MAANETNNFEMSHLYQVLQDFDTAILVTHGQDESLHGRPMAVAKVEENCDLWFFTGADATKCQEIESNAEVLITFQDRDTRFVTLCGRADTRNDPSMVELLWRDLFKIWFPNGKDDPNLSLIHVRTEKGEYWDHAGANQFAFIFDISGTKINV